MASHMIADVGSLTFNLVKFLNPSFCAPPRRLSFSTTSVFPNGNRVMQRGTYSGAEQHVRGPPQMKSRIPVHNSLLCVTMKKQPFYDDKERLLFTSLLAPIFAINQTFKFYINENAAKAVDGQDNLILLRFCRMDCSTPQDDQFPPGLQLFVNDLPFDTKGGPFPMDITSLCHTRNRGNIIQVVTSSGNGIYYVINITRVKKLTVDDLVQKLKAKKLFEIQETKALIKRGLNNPSSDVETTSVQCSLMCPLSMTRITLPCRATSCKHVQVFDGLVYLRMNEQRANWICPVCNSSAHFTNLVIDRYFQNILKEANTCNKINFLHDGKWTPVVNNDHKENPTTQQRVAKKRVVDEVIVIDSDDEACREGNVWKSNETGSETSLRGVGRGTHTALPAPKRCRRISQADCSKNCGPSLRRGRKRITRNSSKSVKGR
nr:E3 SUMO-protein ligase PIAS3-like [Procambarus clarkii]